MQIPTFIKWPGGKRHSLVQISSYLPSEVDRYFEPFLGGGAMFFYIKQKYNPKYCMISDINEDLIQAFKAVRDNPKQLIRLLHYFKRKDSKEFYYASRDLFNQGKIQGLKRSAAFIYFTKTCFNGVYRVNKQGKYNVPYGYYVGREIFNKEDILAASELLQGVTIKRQDYTKILPKIKKEDLVYLDPCYDPLKRTSFVHYTPARFSKEQREELYGFITTSNLLGANIVLSNNNVVEVRDLYKDLPFRINYVESARCVNVNPEGRGRISELLITNY